MKGRTRRLYEKALVELKREARGERVRPAFEKKKQLYSEILETLKTARSFLLIPVTGVDSNHVKKVRAALEKEGVKVKMYKPKIFLKAARDLGLKNIDKLEGYLTQPLLYAFSDRHNVFELTHIVTSVKSYRRPLPGEVAETEIVIPAGPTDIPPGPMMSVFGRLRIPVQPREGKIHIMRDTVVAKPGQTISPELSSLMDKLGLTTVVIQIKPAVGYDEGTVIEGEDLILDIESYIQQFTSGYINALSVASEIALPVPEAMELSLRKAAMRAMMLSVELGVINESNIELALRLAVARSLALGSAISDKADLGIEVAQPQPQQQAAEKKEEKKEEQEEEEEKKEVSEEELEQGLSALFG